MTTEAEYIEAANADPTPYPNRVSLLYGDQGKRKTTTACSMVNERGLLLSTDDSWDVLLNPSHSALLDRVKIIKLTHLSQLDYINFEGDEKGEFDTIIWDTISESVDSYIDLLYDKATWGPKYRESITINKDASEEAKKELKGLQILSPMDYRVTRDKLRDPLSKVLATGKHVVLTSQQNEPMPGMGNQQRRPGIPNATFKMIARRCSLIGYITPGKSDFTIDFSEDSVSFLGKSRIERLRGKMPLTSFVNTYKEIVFP